MDLVKLDYKSYLQFYSSDKLHISEVYIYLYLYIYIQ